MRALLLIIPFFLAAFFCLLPERAFAWGPGVHFVTGNWLLQNLAFLPVAIASVIMRNPEQFLHGLLSADIFIGKGSKAQKGHSHNWESGFALLDEVHNAQQEAYAYGYLCHLAADTVAHNVLVPGLLQTAPGRGKAAHVYLEIQADSLLQWSSRDAIALFYEKDSPAALAMLQRSMHRRSLPFWLNTRIFQSSIAIGGSSFWRDSMERFDRFLWEPGRKGQLDYLLTLSTRAMFNLLQEGGKARILGLDPIGADAIAAAEKLATKRRSIVASGIRRQFYKTLDRHIAATGLNSFNILHPLIRYRTEQPLSISPGLDVPAILQSLPPACRREQELP